MLQVYDPAGETQSRGGSIIRKSSLAPSQGASSTNSVSLRSQRNDIWVKLLLMMAGPLIALILAAIFMFTYQVGVANDSRQFLIMTECAARVNAFTSAAQNEREASFRFIEGTGPQAELKVCF